VFKWYKANGIKVPKLDEKFLKLLSLAPKKTNKPGSFFGIKPTHKGSGSYYRASENEINITNASRIKESIKQNERILYHEYGHAIHNRQNILRHDSFGDKSDSNLKNIFSKLRADGYKNGRTRVQREAFDKVEDNFDRIEISYSRAFRKYFTETRIRNNVIDSDFFEKELGLKKGSLKGMNVDDINEAFTSYADTLEALSKGEIGFGHGKEYYKSDYRAQAEFFAHSMENRFLGNPIFEHFDKSLFDDMVKMVDEILEENGI
jgi:hypothetical protein